MGCVDRGLWSVNHPFPRLPLGLLAVFDAYDTSDKETKQGETPGAASDLNRLEKDLIYVGGLPHSKAVRYDVKPRGSRVEFPGLSDSACEWSSCPYLQERGQQQKLCGLYQEPRDIQVHL